MLLRRWDDLPDFMRNDDVKKYYEVLLRKKISLYMKRMFDILLAILIFIILSPAFIIISIAIKLDSRGPTFYRQIRVTQYGKQFRIFKFRTMINNADKIGTQVTINNDDRITKLGRVLRKIRLDEIPQLFNIISGDMSFVGTRPEVLKYVKKYSDEMKSTLLLPAGLTSEASIKYKDEERLLASVEDADEIYLKDVLPEKMKYNLKSIENFSLINDVKTMIHTVFAVIKHDKSKEITVNNSEVNI